MAHNWRINGDFVVMGVHLLEYDYYHTGNLILFTKSYISCMKMAIVSNVGALTIYWTQPWTTEEIKVYKLLNESAGCIGTSLGKVYLYKYSYANFTTASVTYQLLYVNNNISMAIIGLFKI